eukprot:gene7998-7394_t
MAIARHVAATSPSRVPLASLFALGWLPHVANGAAACDGASVSAQLARPMPACPDCLPWPGPADCATACGRAPDRADGTSSGG